VAARRRTRPALAACVDAAEYSFYYGLVSIGWAIDRTLLQLAYQLDQLRWYLVETAFTRVALSG